MAPPTTPELTRAADVRERMKSKTGDVRGVGCLVASVTALKPKIMLTIGRAAVRQAMALGSCCATRAIIVMKMVRVLEAAHLSLSLRSTIIATKNERYEHQVQIRRGTAKRSPTQA